jgi:hypothetical protein
VNYIPDTGAAASQDKPADQDGGQMRLHEDDYFTHAATLAGRRSDGRHIRNVAIVNFDDDVTIFP